MRTASLLGAFLLSCGFVRSAEVTPEVLAANLKGNPPEFEPVEIGKGRDTVSFEIELGKTVVTTDEGFVFDGFRLTAPAKIEGDFVWYFNAPADWGHWYILPSNAEMKPAFRGWFDGDKIYVNLDRAKELNRFRAFQSLTADFFEPDEDYLIWFRRHQEGNGDQTLRGRLKFANRPENESGWDIVAIEEALELKPQPAAAQIAEQNWRGGRILLDPAFFKPSYAKGRIDHAFFSRRRTRYLPNGFFISMEFSVPPCETEPSFPEIREKYGEPDFTQSAAERTRVGQGTDGDEGVVTHFYDHFGFEVQADDPKERVMQVVSMASDFATLRDAENENSFGHIPMKHLTAFYQKGVEVGRIYHFNASNDDPVVINEPPTGIYRRSDEEFEYLGEGAWLQRKFYESGDVSQTARYSKHRLDGKSEGFYQNGQPRFTLTYQNGRLHGELIQFSEDGSEQSRRHFENGEEVESSR